MRDLLRLDDGLHCSEEIMVVIITYLFRIEVEKLVFIMQILSISEILDFVCHSEDGITSV